MSDGSILFNTYLFIATDKVRDAIQISDPSEIYRPTQTSAVDEIYIHTYNTYYKWG